MEIIWLNDAVSDLTNYRQNSNIITKGKIEFYIASLVDYVDILAFSPFMGKVFFYYKDVEIRQLVYKMHRIIYYIKNKEIRILAVIHTSRNIDNIMDYINRFF